LVLALFFLAGAVLAGEPPPPPGEGEEKPKTPEELRWEKIVEILQTLIVSDEEEPDPEKEEKILTEAKKALVDLGPEAVPQLETLLPTPDKRGFPVHSEKLCEILSGERDEAVDLIIGALRTHGWVSPEDKARLARLQEDLKDKESDPRDLASQFAELDWFGVQGLKEVFDGSKDVKFRMKIVEILDRVSKQLPVATVVFLLDLTFDKSVEIKRKVMSSLADIAYDVDDDDFKKLKAILKEERAYAMLVGFLRHDPDPDVRMYAAKVLGNLGLKEAAQELINALNDRKERVQGEAVEALLMLARPLVKDIKDFDALVRNLEAWWRSSKSKFPKQIKAAPPVRYKKPAKKEGK
jgi:HEAT repeat protein